jgi:hypothetical protein
MNSTRKMFGISFGSIYTILKENLNKRRIAASFASRAHVEILRLEVKWL